MFNMKRPLIAWLPVLLIAAPPRVARGDCPPVIVRLPELVQSQSIVLRLQSNGLPSSLYRAPCSFKIDGDSGYRQENEIPEYEIVEVFKGNFTAGASIAVLYGTDTGFRVALPSRFTTEASEQGFLAFLSPVTFCFDNNDTAISMERGDLNVYSMSECVEHEPWDNLSDDDRAFLYANAGADSNNNAPVGGSSGSSSSRTIWVATSKKAALLLTIVLWYI